VNFRLLLKRILTYFLHGLLFTVPIAATLYIIYKAFNLVDSIIPLNIPGLGLVIIFAAVTVLGYLSSFYFANPLLASFEKVIERTPLVKIIYSSVKDLIAAFVGEKKRFSHPVMVTTNINPQVQRIGFITQNDLTHLGLGTEKVAVYLPFSYGMNGMLVIVEKQYVTPIDASGTEMMKFVISGGVTEI
jgi:uncharacterized membrane protein